MKIIVKIEGQENSITLKGRTAWALCQLERAGERGISVIDRPAPRWSSYVAMLREKGFLIDTEMREHGGAFPGRHGVYRLQTPVEITKAS